MTPEACKALAVLPACWFAEPSPHGGCNRFDASYVVAIEPFGNNKPALNITFKHGGMTNVKDRKGLIAEIMKCTREGRG